MEKGLRELQGVAINYKHVDERLGMHTQMWLDQIRNIFALTLILKPFVPFDEWVKVENVHTSFVSFYKFSHNLGDNVRPEDFRKDWARDIAQGLACLYE